MVAQCMASLQYVCKRESSIFSMVNGLIAEMILTLSLFVTLCNGLNIAESEA